MSLLDEGATIPFIARYRQQMTGEMSTDDLRHLNSSYINLKNIKTKAQEMVKKLDKSGKLNNYISNSFLSVTIKSELDSLCKIYSPTVNKGTKAHQARQIPGIKEITDDMINGLHIRPQSLVNPKIPGLEMLSDITMAIQYVLADIFYTDNKLIQYIRTEAVTYPAMITSAKVKSKEGGDDSDQYQNYYDFKRPVKLISSHQILAIFRGEAKKRLRLKIEQNASLPRRLSQFALTRWPRITSEWRPLFNKAVDDAYTRLINPMLNSKMKSELFDKAEKESLQIFQKNLRHLLLTPPIKGLVVLGVDPGFLNGCKLAVTNANGDILATNVAYLHGCAASRITAAINIIRSLIIDNRCTTVAIGNGSACRETERFFSKHIKDGTFYPMKPVYCIVNEAGTSTYSASKVGQAELPDMNIILRSAVSIARRLQEPLAEYVKVEPKHLGIGMYQHDISELKLKESLQCIVEECVSFVGVDINTASEILLTHVSGIGKAKAQKIVKYRSKHGRIQCRDELNSIPGIGKKTFQQCAGFIRVLEDEAASSTAVVQALGKRKQSPEDSDYDGDDGPNKKLKKKKASAKAAKPSKAAARFTYNKLDVTNVHPEDYCLAQRIIEDQGFRTKDIGSKDLIQHFSMINMNILSKKLGLEPHEISFIIKSLQTPLHKDIRDDFSKPIFKSELTTVDSLKVGMKITGKVQNVCSFGAFVDIGVNQDGLIHTSKMRGQTLRLGDCVDATVIRLEGKKISLSL